METKNPEIELARNYALYTHRNIFLTGKAGTGKTTFLRHLQEESSKRMIVVAPTGVAAINAGGVTIHSFFQLAPGLFLPGKMVAGGDARNRFSFSKQKVNILRSLDLLVIDEISMVRADLLDAIDDVLRRYQKRDQPFGGVQLLLIGDLQQLAPVATEQEWPLLQEFYQTPYFFSSQALQQTDFVYIELHHVYRQQDNNFVNILNAVRDNQLTTQVMQVLNARYKYQGKEDQVTTEQMEEDFNNLSLEYKLLNINQVRSFARYLNAIDCFYTDKPVDYDMLKTFTPEMTSVFAPMEHARWVRDHQLAGWHAGNEYETVPLPEGTENEDLFHRALREQFRRHKLTLDIDASEEEMLAHYETLSPEDQGKDWLPFNSMLKLLRKYDGLRIYRLDRE